MAEQGRCQPYRWGLGGLLACYYFLLITTLPENVVTLSTALPSP
jgi:hypothetical protein